MDNDGTYFFSEALEDQVLAPAAAPPAVPFDRDTGPAMVEGETLPEAALQVLRSWFGF